MSQRFDLSEILRLYLVADPDQMEGDFLVTVAEAVAHGVTAVQLRSKLLNDGPFLALARAVKGICDVHAVPVFINDRVDIALATGADGVHVGMDDLPLAAVRSLVGKDVLLGYSPATTQQLADGVAAGSDYVGLGPVFATSSKADAGTAIGPEGIRLLAGSSSVPTVGIGGITPENAAEVIAAGADGVAVISAILRSGDPANSTARLRRTVDEALAGSVRHG